jgi:hypothetical protein
VLIVLPQLVTVVRGNDACCFMKSFGARYVPGNPGIIKLNSRVVCRMERECFRTWVVTCIHMTAFLGLM